MEAGDQPWTIHVTVQPMPWPEDAETTLELAPPTDDELGPEGETG